MIRERLRRLRRDERGYSLIELLVVMAILGVVMGGLTTIFVSGGNAEVDMNRRFQSQEQARLASDRIRTDVHCAQGAAQATINGYPGLGLNVSDCSTTAPYVYYCVELVTSSPLRYQLWRTTSTSSTTTSTTCTSSDTSRELVADYLTMASTALTTPDTPVNGLHTVVVDFQVDVNPTSTTKDSYELTDTLVARNSVRCTVTTCDGVSTWPTTSATG